MKPSADMIPTKNDSLYPIPVLFIIFKRPQVALTAFERIRRVKPSRLYIAGDGSRKSVDGEQALVEETRRRVLDAIDWDCEVHTLFHDENLGCSMGVYTAIEWLFCKEECGIILEDDCVMQDSFFPFVEELLIKYKDDQRIGMIDGANYVKGVEIPDSYGFSRYKSTNGWATWRRAWQLMDMNLDWRKTPYKKSIIANMGYRSKDIKYWKYRIKVIDHHDASAWDWQWYFTLAAHNMLAIYPQRSLITNIGFGEGATHTSSSKTPSYFISNDDLQFPLRHPPHVVPFEPFERGFYNLNNNLYTNTMKYIPMPLKKFLKKAFKL